MLNPKMSITGNKIIPPVIFVPVGGLGMSMVGKYTKRALYDIVHYAIKKGKYPLVNAPALETPMESISEGSEILNIWDEYNRWHVYYKEDSDPLNAYICTGRGFFNINLYSFAILKALPSKNPCLSPNILNIYSELNQGRSGGLVSPDEKVKLEKIQMICLLNLLLKDLCSLNIKKQRLPEFFMTVIKALNSYDNTTFEINDFKSRLPSKDNPQWNEARQFLTRNIHQRAGSGKSFFYANQRQSEVENIKNTGKLGMVFRYSLNERMVLDIIAEDTREKILRESVLMTGQWVYMFKMHYYITPNP